MQAPCDAGDALAHQLPTLAVERRVAPDGLLYTRQEFLAFFGGLDEWHAAKVSAAAAGAGNAADASAVGVSAASVSDAGALAQQLTAMAVESEEPFGSLDSVRRALLRRCGLEYDKAVRKLVTHLEGCFTGAICDGKRFVLELTRALNDKRTSIEFMGRSSCRLNHFPLVLCVLTELRTLNLSGHAIGKLPQSFEHLQALEEVVLRGTRLEHLPDVLRNRPALTSLDVAINLIGSLRLDGFATLTSLDVSDNPLPEDPRLEDLVRVQLPCLHRLKSPHLSLVLPPAHTPPPLGSDVASEHNETRRLALQAVAKEVESLSWVEWEAVIADKRAAEAKRQLMAIRHARESLLSRKDIKCSAASLRLQAISVAEETASKLVDEGATTKEAVRAGVDAAQRLIPPLRDLASIGSLQAALSEHEGAVETGDASDVSDDTSHVPSVATSAITLMSTHHSHAQAFRRDLDRRQLQSTVKHGEASQSSNGTLRIEHNGITVVTDHAAKLTITAWDERSQKRAEGKYVAPAFRKWPSGGNASSSWRRDEAGNVQLTRIRE